MEVGVDIAERLVFFWIPHLANRFLYIYCLPTQALDQSCQGLLEFEILRRPEAILRLHVPHDMT